MTVSQLAVLGWIEWAWLCILTFLIVVALVLGRR